jgi:hypothetical protein
MTRQELIAFGKARHGKVWIGPLAQEIGYDPSTLLRIASGEIRAVSRRLELEVTLLKRESARVKGCEQ